MTQSLAEVLSVRTGCVQTHEWDGRTVESGGAKSERQGRVRLTELGLQGDEQADLRVHGGPDKAVLVYAAHHYPAWAADHGLQFPEGGFFENLTVGSPVDARLDETTTRLGERWRLGSAIVQVSQPRSPCWKLARRWQIPDLVPRVQDTGWTGWYLRILEPGEVAAGDTIQLADRPAGAPTIAEVGRILNRDKHDLDGARRLLEYPDLPERWRSKLEARLGGAIEDDSRRLHGPAGH